MTPEGQFDAVLEELRALLIAFNDLAHHVVLVGGQVLAVEAKRQGGTGEILVRTPTGVVVPGRFTMEPDLLLDVDAAAARADHFLDALRACGFRRIKGYRWHKDLASGLGVDVDLFVPEDAEEENMPAAGLTRLPGGDLALARPDRVTLRLEGGNLDVAVPEPAAFIAMKLAAKGLRPLETKDCFDLYAYVVLRTPALVAQSLSRWDASGAMAASLRELFADVDKPGVVDVLTFAASLSEDERALLARHVVDVFDATLASRRALLEVTPMKS